MKRVGVASSDLVSVGHDAASGTLEVEFKDGSVYQYFGVPSTIFDQLLGASSKGSFFARQIKKRFQFSRVS